MRTETAATTAAFAAAAPFPHLNGCRSRAMALAVMCGVILSMCNNDGVVAAFSPPYHVSPPSAIIHDTSNRVAASSAMRTRLAYKHLDGRDEYDAKDETALDNGGEMLMSDPEEERGINVKVDVDVSVEISKDVIYYNYNDLSDPVSVSSSSFSASFTSQSIRFDSRNNEGEGLTHELEHELENTIQQKNINLDDTPSPKATPKLKAIEPSKTKPSKKFISPIQLYQVGS